MKIDFVKTIIAIAISCLVAYGFYTICEYDNLRWLLTSISGVMLSLFLIFTIGIRVKAERTAVMISILSIMSFCICGIVNLVFAFFDFSKPLFIISNGLLLLVYTLIINSMYKNRQ